VCTKLIAVRVKEYGLVSVFQKLPISWVGLGQECGLVPVFSCGRWLYIDWRMVVTDGRREMSYTLLALLWGRATWSGTPVTCYVSGYVCLSVCRSIPTSDLVLPRGPVTGAGGAVKGQKTDTKWFVTQERKHIERINLV